VPEIVNQVTDHTPFPYPGNEKYAVADNSWSDDESALVKKIAADLLDMNE